MSAFQTLTRGLTKIFGSRNERLVKSYRKRVEQINAFEPKIRALTDEQLRQRTVELRQQVAGGKAKMSAVLPEALAIVRESLDRNVGIRSIFNPQFKGQLDLSRLPAAVRATYERLQAEMEKLPPIDVPGDLQPVPGWLQIDLPLEIYAAVRELYPESRPPFRTRPFDVQLIGAMVLYEGKIAEMKTGEGKTIVGPMACFLACLEGLKCHVVTVNDYLVQRDRDWVFPAFHRLGLSVGAIHPFHMQPEEVKRDAYRCDVVYGTNSEFGFDYLRDNMKLSLEDQVQRRRDFCIVDEIDSILIDEARTPLIISGPAHDDAPQYLKANQVAEQLVQIQKQANQKTLARLNEKGFAAEQARLHHVPESQIQKVISKFRDLGADFLDDKEAGFLGHTQYYIVRREQKGANMTHLGVEEAQKLVGTRFYVVGNDMAWDHLISNALRAHAIYERDKDYVVQNGEVVIVDEFTGRLMIGRQWSDGLHQAVEAKEARHGVKIKQETQTLATVTIQNFFKLYKRLAGMTGTAATEGTEFNEIYRLEVVVIPTNRPVIRQDNDDLIFLTERAKWKAILEDIREKSEAGRPVLVGTTSVEKSEKLSRLLADKHGIEHEVLNAKQHEREAHIVAKAGQQTAGRGGKTVGSVTIATNMAGRGTDIKLTEATRQAGGLHIIGTERHEARRIDNQLRGRSGRQGDPGSSRFFISMEDDLMKMFAGKATMRALSMMGMQEDDAIEHKWITRSVERAQTKVEQRSYQIRKNLLEYDEVMEHQRSSFYGTRQQVLEAREIEKMILDYIAESIEDAAAHYLAPDYIPNQVAEAARSLLGATINPARLRGENLSEVETTIYSDAKNDIRQEIEISVGEYMSADVDPADWDLRGLSDWAMSRFSVSLKITRLKEMSEQEVIEELTAAAHELIERRPLESLGRFYDPAYAATEIVAWAKNKFDLDLPADELAARRGEKPDDRQQRVAEFIYERAAKAYRKREREYPIQFTLDMVFDTARQSPEGTQWAVDRLVQWANHRYDLGWTRETALGLDGGQIARTLAEASEKWHGPALKDWVEKALFGDPKAAELAERFEKRWGRKLDEKTLPAARPDRTALLDRRARSVLRTELTQLEQYVLLQILDQSWKDHLYAMDQLRDSVGLRGYAEKDPKIEYKSEGSRMFRQMLKGVRDKVTDLVFKARLTAQVEVKSVFQNMQARHDVIEDTSVAAAVGATAPAGTAEQKADLEAARRAGSEGAPAPVQQIVKSGPTVGRNDPCPCGSGKKYKKCCGQ